MLCGQRHAMKMLAGNNFHMKRTRKIFCTKTEAGSQRLPFSRSLLRPQPLKLRIEVRSRWKPRENEFMNLFATQIDFHKMAFGAIGANLVQICWWNVGEILAKSPFWFRHSDSDLEESTRKWIFCKNGSLEVFTLWNGGRIWRREPGAAASRRHPRSAAATERVEQ